MRFSTSLFLLSISCDNNEGDSSEMANDTVRNNWPLSAGELPLSGCYLMTHQKDTAILIIKNVHNNVVFGALQYKWFEKDHSDGFINGVLRDNLIIANYNFQSEGVSSVREVVFSIKNDSLFEGYGKVVVQNDTARFVNTRQLTFMKDPFVKVHCTDK